MKHHMRAGALALVLIIAAAPLQAQATLLPQLFRDLPPELQEGLPAEMTYEEYLDMTRSVDFFSMFMAVWVPGYALFGVDERELAWGVAGVRAAGAGMILTGLARQWDDFEDIWQLSTITESPQRYRNAVTNLSLMAGGFFINGVAWAFDVATAYRIARNDKSYVQYKYGVLTSTDGSDRERAEEYIRTLARQEGSAVGDDLERSLRRYLDRYPESDFVADAEYQLAALLAAEDRDAEAMLVVLRQLAVHPDARIDPASRRLGAHLVQRNRGDWDADRGMLLELLASAPSPGAAAAPPGGAATPGMAESPESPPAQGAGNATHDVGTPSGRYARFLASAAGLETRAFRELYSEQAAAFIERYPDAAIAPHVLFTRAGHLRDLDRSEEAVVAYTQLAVAYPESEFWAPAMLEVGTLLEDELNEPEYAVRFYRRLVEERPGTDSARAAQNRL